jgi:hypothetical protein
MDAALRSMLRQTITYQAYSALGDQYGQSATFGSEIDFRARVSPTSKLVVTSAGREVVASWVVWLDPGDTVIGSQDRITLPDGSTPHILTIERLVDERGQSHHTKVYLGYQS